MLDYDKIMPLVKNVASSVSSKFPPYVLASDTEGTLLLWIYQNRSHVESAVEDGPEWEAKIASTLRKVAFDHCNSEKAGAEGYNPEDVYRYQTERIRAIIPIALDYQGWQPYDVWDEGVNMYRKEKPTLEEVVDIKDGISKLAKEARALIILQYKYGWYAQDLADALDITLEAARKRSQRALRALQKQLGYKDPLTSFKGVRRPSRTNASARAELQNMYEG